MTATAGPAASAAQFGRSAWIWPAAGAALAIWPVWRSLAPQMPDLQVPPAGLQAMLGLAEAALCGAWIARYRHRVGGLVLPLLGLGTAVAALLIAIVRGDIAVTDLASLALCWFSFALLLAGALLLEGQRAYAALQGAAVPPASMLLPSHERIGYWLFGIALAVAGIQHTWQGFLLAGLAVASPGAVLAWAALCDTARTVLARRNTHVGDLACLPALAEYRAIVLSDHGMLVARRPKVVGIVPAGDAKPGNIVSIAAALLADNDDDAARAVHEFGVSHRVRVPDCKPLEAAEPQLRRGRLPDRSVMEIGPIESGIITAEERSPFEEQIARATELRRGVLAVREIEPRARLLGLLMLAKVARPGAAEALRTLRKAGFGVTLANPMIAPEDREAISGFGFDAPAERAGAAPAVGVLRPGDAPLDNTAMTVQFGGRSRATPEREADIIVAREDPRTLVDLLQFARDFRRRVRASIVIACLPGVGLFAAALGFVPAWPIVVTGVALTGLALAIAAPQVLRLSPTIANEVDEE